MTVETTTSYSISLGNGVADEFPFGFKVLDEDHILVQRRIADTGVIDKTYTSSEYTIDGIGEDAGSVTLLDGALPSDYELIIQRIVPYTQEVDIVNQGGFYPDVVERQLDLHSMGLQQLDTQLERTIRVPLGEEAPTYEEFGEIFRGDPGGTTENVSLFTTLQLGLTVIPAGTQRIRTSGYSVVGIGFADYAENDDVDAAYVAAYPRFSFLSADGRGWKFAEPKIDITQCGMLGDDATNNTPALTDLLEWLQVEAQGYGSGSAYIGAMKVTAPLGTFRFNGHYPWRLKFTLNLEGQGVGKSYDTNATTFSFEYGGFYLERYNTLNGAQQIPSGYGSDGTIIKGITLHSRQARPAAGVYAAQMTHGVVALARYKMENCVVQCFTGDGLYQPSGGGTIAGVSDNNNNCSVIMHTGFRYNGRNGAYMEGPDCNACNTFDCTFDYNYERGLKDSCFLNNIHIGHHAEGNCGYNIPAGHPFSKAGPYGGICTHGGNRYYVAEGQHVAASTTTPGTNSAVWVFEDVGGGDTMIPAWVTGMNWISGGSYFNDSINNTVFFACYEEWGQPHAYITGLNMVVGGTIAPSGGAVHIGARQGTLKCDSGISVQKTLTLGTIALGFGTGTGNLFGSIDHSTLFPSGGGTPNHITTLIDTDRIIWGMYRAGSVIGDPAVSFGGVGSVDQDFFCAHHFKFGPLGNTRQMTLDTGAPGAAGTRGDIRWNRDPVAGGTMGWMCTTTGGAGVAVWKAMPNLAA